MWETTTNIIKAQSLYRYDPDGSPYWRLDKAGTGCPQ